MKITLIAPTPPDISAFGVRSLSAYLRSKGFDCRLIFLPGSIGKLTEKGDFAYGYEKDVLRQVSTLCSDSQLIGVSFMTNYYDRSVQITQALKKNLDVPVIWGGIHPSSDPDESLKYADIVCIGDGEDALLELCRRMKDKSDYFDIQGLWFKKDGAVIRNNIRNSLIDLDAIPFFDFGPGDHHILDSRTGQIVPLDMEIFRKALPRLPHPDGKLKIAYRTMTDRGCPHKCTYCNISSQKELYDEVGIKYFRKRSIRHSITELVEVKKRFPFIEAVQFFDDTFFARPIHEIEEFSKLYNDEVALPFYCQASPNTISQNKMKFLVDAGLVYVEMGVQTGSERIKKLYNRSESNEKIIEAACILSEYKGKILPPDYHVILDNPWETQEDVMDTAKLLMKLPKPYGLCISSLVFFPQTPLYIKAKNEGLIKDEVSDIYRKPFFIPPKRTYANFLIYLLTFQHFPKMVLKLLARDSVIQFCSRTKLDPVFKFGYLLGEKIRFIAKGIKVLYHRDWERIRLYRDKVKLNDPLVDGRKQ